MTETGLAIDAHLPLPPLRVHQGEQVRAQPLHGHAAGTGDAVTEKHHDRVVAPFLWNRGILRQLKTATCKDMLSALKAVDQDLLKAAVAGERFQELFFANAKDEGIRDYIKGLVGERALQDA